MLCVLFCEAVIVMLTDMHIRKIDMLSNINVNTNRNSIWEFDDNGNKYQTNNGNE